MEAVKDFALYPSEHTPLSSPLPSPRLKKLEDSNKQLREKLLQKQVGQLQAKPQANLAQ